ncbi:MAG: family 78 glycoside hydrolase catalytic domain [Clostridia bacterium]|nr:family 78 glycoside hydrolase catalytic domain [Clostridia bacterium]
MKLSTRFIKASMEMCGFDRHIPAPYIRKTFTLKTEPKRAEITICGLGFYELYVNGRNITKGPLAPYISNPDDVCYYDHYTLDGLLKKGKNAVGILLGNGFRNAFGGFVWDFDKAACRGAPTVALCLEAADGESLFELEADETFRVHPSPIRFDDERMGCRYDARCEIPGWSEADFDDSGWANALPEQKPRGIARLCEAEPITVTEELKPVSITYHEEMPFCYESMKSGAAPLEGAVAKRAYVYDFGVNGAGVTRLAVKNAAPGQTVIIRHAEDLVHGCVSVNSTVFLRKNTMKRYIEYGQTDVYICRGGDETFTPSFKYDGFRYAIVEGLTKEQADENALAFLVMNSALKERAGFSCSDPVLNQLQACARRSDLSNFYYFPTDCPHREKNGWTGDASVSAEHMLLNLTAEKSLREWLLNIRLAQRADGALPGIVPTGGWGFAWGNGPAWDSVCVTLPYYIYRFTGNREVILENAGMMMRYLYYISRRRDARGLIAVGLGDWLDPFEKERGGIASPLCVTDSATVFDLARKAAFLFSQAGLTREADYAFAFAKDVRSSFRKHLIDPETGAVAGECQTSQAIALETGLFDENELPAARRRLVEIIHRDRDVNACGMIGLRYVYHALVHAGEADLAYQLITSPSRSCYGYWAAHGATSLWECFPDLNVSAGGSKNHHFMGDISSLFIQEFAGLKPNPRCDDVNACEISPRFVRKLDFAEAYYLAPLGKISVRWDRTPDGIAIRVRVPKGIKGNLVLPEGYRLADGRMEMPLNGLDGATAILAVFSS